MLLSCAVYSWRSSKNLPYKEDYGTQLISALLQNARHQAYLNVSKMSNVTYKYVFKYFSVLLCTLMIIIVRAGESVDEQYNKLPSK